MSRRLDADVGRSHSYPGRAAHATRDACIRVCPDIAVSDIVSSRHDIVSFFLISDPILVILAPISGQYRDIPIPYQTRYYQYRARYRVFPLYRLRYRVNIETYPFLAKPDIGVFTNIVPDMVLISQKISKYTDIWTKKTSMSFLTCMQYSNIPI
jgi:hypothetical protein